MKTVFGILLFVILGASFAIGQHQGAKVVTELYAGSEKIVKGSPFSADAVSESVQVLADGNRIVRSSTGKLYRNSDGRFRREGGGGTAGILGSYFELQNGISIVAPDAGYRYYLNPDSKTGRSIMLSTPPEAVVSGSQEARIVAVPRVEAITKLKEELKAAQAVDGAGVTAQSPEARVEIEKLVTKARSAAAEVGVRAGVGYAGEFTMKGRTTRTEQLGMQNIEGVEAEGTRTITTIEAGAIGNERPMEIVYERWYSKELQLVVYSKHNDPRFGEQTYRLTNITRSEPDPSLFTLPRGYNITRDPGGVYKVTTTKGEKNVYTVVAPTITSVKAGRP